MLSCSRLPTPLSLCILFTVELSPLFPNQLIPGSGDTGQSVRLCAGQDPLPPSCKTRTVPEHRLFAKQCYEIPAQLLCQGTGKALVALPFHPVLSNNIVLSFSTTSDLALLRFLLLPFYFYMYCTFVVSSPVPISTTACCGRPTGKRTCFLSHVQNLDDTLILGLNKHSFTLAAERRSAASIHVRVSGDQWCVWISGV